MTTEILLPLVLEYGENGLLVLLIFLVVYNARQASIERKRTNDVLNQHLIECGEQHTANATNLAELTATVREMKTALKILLKKSIGGDE